MCDVKKFTEDLLSLGQCCLDKVSNEWAVRAWNFRAEFWTKDYTEQSEIIIGLLNAHFNLKTGKYQFLLLHWPVCTDCLMKLIGISKKRYKKYKHAWEQSGRSILRVESRHKTKTRPSPKQDIFREYLDSLAQVRPFFRIHAYVHLIFFCIKIFAGFFCENIRRIFSHLLSDLVWYSPWAVGTLQKPSATCLTPRRTTISRRVGNSPPSRILMLTGQGH